MKIKTSNGTVKIFTDDVEKIAFEQIHQLADSILGKDANIRIMPDVHAGAGCVIGTTMKIADKVCPNLVGVDISCGVTLVKTTANFKNNLEKLDNIIKKKIPSGSKNHKLKSFYKPLEELKCWSKLSDKVKDSAQYSLGTLGGGNHFIEAYDGGYLSVHSGSRNIGCAVAEFYQDIAIRKKTDEKLLDSLAYLEGKDFENYLHDTKILDDFAFESRKKMLHLICEEYDCDIVDIINSTHNYIDTKTMILRKGAIRANKDEKLVIPFNMRDGLLLCVGKGNADWNNSAPHGAGRIYSRAKAKSLFTVEQFKKSMKGIYTSCINKDTLDEAPFVYKDYKKIMDHIEPTVEVIKRLIPIYNFKSK